MPLSDETVSAGLIDWTRIGTGGTSRLGVQADVGDYPAGREAELLRIRSSEPLLWRGGTMDYFDGVRWSDTTQPAADDGEEIAPDVETRPVLQRVQVLNAQTDLIFGGYKIVRTSEYRASPNSDGSWSTDEPFEEGDFYEVFSEIPQPTRAQLRGAGSDYPSSVEQKFLQLPEDTRTRGQRDGTEDQRRYDPATPYDRARAIEQYLIYDGGFTYNLDVSYRRADKAVEEFLGEGKEGFCTQFSTSMALLLRDMNVPSRVVYGSTSGEEVSQGEYLVRGSNMHTWVEAYFPGVGWYPFNPTWILHAGRDGGQRPAVQAAGQRDTGRREQPGQEPARAKQAQQPGSATRTRRIKVPPRAAPGRTLFRYGLCSFSFPL